MKVMPQAVTPRNNGAAESVPMKRGSDYRHGPCTSFGTVLLPAETHTSLCPVSVRGPFREQETV
jgi:hypothetical protein